MMQNSRIALLQLSLPMYYMPETPKIQLEGISAQIVDILDEYIKPAVASDGGNIAFRSYDEEHKIVSVVLQGACSGCPR